MKIRAELYTSKPNKEGHFPIKILFQGKKQNRISTGIYCKKKSHFDIKMGRFVSRNGDPDYKQHNQQIEELLLKYQSRKKELEDAGKEPTFELLTNETPILNSKTEELNFIDIVQEYADNCKDKEGISRHNTKRGYIALKNFLITHYGETIDISEINSRTGYQRFVELLNKHKKGKNATKNRMTTRLGAILKYSYENDYIDSVKLGKIIKFTEDREEAKLNLTTNEITELINQFKKTTEIKHPSYHKMSGEDIALYLWNFHVAFQGINNADMFKLRVKDLHFKTIKKLDVNVEKYRNDSDYRQYIDKEQEEREVVEIAIHRKKVSDSKVKILADRETLEPFLELFYYGKNPNEFLVHNKLDYKKEYTDKEFTLACDSFYNIKKDQINRFWRKCHIKAEWDSLTRITFAHTRHAFINRLIDLEVEKHIISKIVGHSIKITLDYYIDTRLPEWEHSKIVSLIYNEIKPISQLMKNRDKTIKKNKEKPIYSRQDYTKHQYETIDTYRNKNLQNKEDAE